MTTNSGKIFEILQLIPAPLRFYQQNSGTFVNNPRLCWFGNCLVRDYLVRSSVFHCRCMSNVITICNAFIVDKGLQVNWQRNLRANRQWLLLIKRFPDKSKSKLIRKKLSYSYLIITEHWLNSWRNYKSINDLIERLILLLFLLEWKQLQLFIIIITRCTKFTTNLSQLS